MHRITAMSSTTAISLADSLPTIVPKLDLFGLNWTIFHICFQDAVEAKGFWSHFDSTSPKPPTRTIDKEIANSLQWKKDKRAVKLLLTQKIPDLTLIKVHSKPTVKD